MKTWKYCFIILWSLGLGHSNLVAKNLAWEELKINQKDTRVSIQVRGNEGVYYAVSKDNPLELKVTGPRKLLVHIRSAFVSHENRSKEFKMNVMLDQRTFDEFTFRARPSKISKLLNDTENLEVGRLRKFVVEIPEGQHFLKFFPTDDMNLQKVFLRFYMSEKLLKSEKRVAMSPEQYEDVVTLVYKEKEQSYYRMSKKSPVRIIVDGPTELKVVTRLEFNRRMKGKYAYQVQTFEDEKHIQTRQYRTYKSDIVSYKNVSSYSPGRARAFLIWVPKGQHTYKLVPVTTSGEPVLVKLLIPQKDITVIQE